MSTDTQNPPVESCVPQMVNPHPLTRKDFQSGQEVKWCPGCGDYGILTQVQNVLPKLGIPREKIVLRLRASAARRGFPTI